MRFPGPSLKPDEARSPKRSAKEVLVSGTRESLAGTNSTGDAPVSNTEARGLTGDASSQKSAICIDLRGGRSVGSLQRLYRLGGIDASQSGDPTGEAARRIRRKRAGCTANRVSTIGRRRDDPRREIADRRSARVKHRGFRLIASGRVCRRRAPASEAAVETTLAVLRRGASE